jgi:ribonuclease BN (tRNA processing enzyme)
VRVTLRGTRGSLPSPYPGTSRYGGNTSCVEVRTTDGTLVVLDAGTGIRAVDAASAGTNRVDILLTHLHMDHIIGLGFFPALYQPGSEVHIWGPPSTVEELHTRLSRYLSPPLFPVTLRDLPSRLTLHDAPRGTFELPGVVVTAGFVCHPGPTLGYRLDNGSGVLAYLPDHEPALGAGAVTGPAEWTSGFDLAANADVLVHDAQYFDDEYAGRVGWGHSSISQAIALAELAGAARLIAFHHDPDHDDDALDRAYRPIEADRAGRVCQVTPAVEGMSFTVGR